MAINIKGTSVSQAKTTPPVKTAPPAEQGGIDLGSLGAGEVQPATTTSTETPATNNTPVGTAAGETPAAPAATVTFAPQQQASHLMAGAQQNTQVEQIKAVQEMRKKMRGGAREFWLNEGSFAKLYFLDGTIIGPSVFDTPMVATHMIQVGGDWVKLVCNKGTEGSCLICDSNGDNPTTMQLFTVINTMPYTIMNGKNKGTVLPARLQMFAAPLKARDILQKRAENHGGTLAGKLFNFSRSSKQDPRTGNDCEYMQDLPMAAVLQKYPLLGDPDENGKPTQTCPINYADAYPILTNAEIAALRPDLAHAAGYAISPVAAATAFAGGDPTAALDDEIPF